MADPKPFARYLTRGGEITANRDLTVDLVERPGYVKATCNGCGALATESAPRAKAWAEDHASTCRAV